MNIQLIPVALATTEYRAEAVCRRLNAGVHGLGLGMVRFAFYNHPVHGVQNYFVCVHAVNARGFVTDAVRVAAALAANAALTAVNGRRGTLEDSAAYSEYLADAPAQ